MKYNVDQELCIGCGMCESLSPDVVKVNGEGKAEVVGEGDGEEAVSSCPVSAITAEAAQETTAAPAETKEETAETAGGKYVCPVCGYVYDPAVGDPDNGVAPGTAFEDLPDGWACPLCGVDKGMFTAQ